MKLSKVYDPSQYEKDIYDLWERSGTFKPKNRGGEGNYSVVVPPPNANAKMHIGTGMTLTLEDVAVRYHRLLGQSTLFLPGADHAGFETQATFEKQLAKTGKSRFDFSREELYKQIWNFVVENRAIFETQFRSMGASVDWSRFTFTLDDKIVNLAYKTFKKMWDEKLIYRGERLVNYCTFHRTGFADIEVVYEDAKTPLYYMKYGPFTLATTRPETKFGDTAVAVNPKDKRYKEWIGKVVTVEGVNGPFEIEVVSDEMVDPNFGTGVVKITPAHDFNDWEVAQRHNLPAKRVINHDGTLNHMAGRFAGMTVIEARKAVVEALKEKGLLVKVDENYKNRIGRCYKCGTVIEPMLMEQWFVDMKPLTGPAIKALKEKKITFYPDAKRTQLIKYLGGLRDWNISRQIAWGIPIPAFQNVNDTDDWIFDIQVDQEILEIDGKTYRRDPDVFDTWFSSSSWPYATLGYPEGEDYQQFYPLKLMETGGEILYPWVARMIMLGLYMTGKIPFEIVYIHGYVMAEDGAKMSKSLGNVIDLGEIMKEFGADAFRMGIIAGRVPAVNRGYDHRKVEDARNFCNKLWNMARFIEDKVGDKFAFGIKPEPKSSADAWILLKLQQSTREISSFLDAYRFAEAYDSLYHLVWDDFADWYIEASKIELNSSVLSFGLETILKLAHPFAPFVTETIWQTLSGAGNNSLLITSHWPEVPEADKITAKVFEEVKNIVSETRYLIAELKLSKPTLYYRESSVIQQNSELIMLLAKLGGVKASEGSNGLQLIQSKQQAWLAVDKDEVKNYAKRLHEQGREQQGIVKRLEGRLANKSYVQNAPKTVVDQTQKQLEQAREHLAKLESEQKRFSS